jgi:alpha/beta superfamily hydrolase
MSEIDVAARNEVPVFIRAAGETLFGIFSRPAGEDLDTAVIVLPGGSTPMTTDRNRISVRLCRRVATLGYHALRFDYHGAGESTGSLGRVQLDRPFVADVQGAMRWIERQGVTSSVLLGSCFGARTALATAAQTEGVRAVILISMPVRDHAMGTRASNDAALRWSIWTYLRRALSVRVIKGLFDRRHREVYRRYARAKFRQIGSRLRRSGTQAARGRPGDLDPVSPHVLSALDSLVDRRVPILFLFGTMEGHQKEFDRATDGALGEILQRAGSLIDVELLRGRVHGFRDAGLQDAVVDAVAGWLIKLEARTAPSVGIDARAMPRAADAN